MEGKEDEKMEELYCFDPAGRQNGFSEIVIKHSVGIKKCIKCDFLIYFSNLK